jgi:REP element-mobilizing transposase RayT
MSRPLRIEIENGIYHVSSRGWERRAIVTDDRDRQQWFELLDRVALRFGWRFFAWMLMDNHFHLFLKTPNADLSAGMHDLNSGYATWFNRRHRRSGSLYQGRFKAILVENESYAWTLSRYIHLNPYRAKMVKRPQDYGWGSYRYFLDPRGAPEWLDWRVVLDEMGRNRSRTRKAYRRFVEQGIQEKTRSPLEDVVANVLLGSAEWVERMRRGLGEEDPDANVPLRKQLAWRPSMEEIEQETAAEFGVAKRVLQAKRVRNNEARAAALCLIRRLTSVPATQLATRYGGVSPAAISKAVQRAEVRCDEDVAWRRRLERLEKKLMTRP